MGGGDTLGEDAASSGAASSGVASGGRWGRVSPAPASGAEGASEHTPQAPTWEVPLLDLTDRVFPVPAEAAPSVDISAFDPAPVTPRAQSAVVVTPAMREWNIAIRAQKLERALTPAASRAASPSPAVAAFLPGEAEGVPRSPSPTPEWLATATQGGAWALYADEYPEEDRERAVIFMAARTRARSAARSAAGPAQAEDGATASAQAEDGATVSAQAEETGNPVPVNRATVSAQAEGTVNPAPDNGATVSAPRSRSGIPSPPLHPRTTVLPTVTLPDYRIPHPATLGPTSTPSFAAVLHPPRGRSAPSPASPASSDSEPNPWAMRLRY